MPTSTSTADDQQDHAADSTATNNHWVTSVMVTIVHPKTDAPQEVSDYVADAIARNMPDAWGEGATRISSSVGTYIPAGDAGEDVPDWYGD